MIDPRLHRIVAPQPHPLLFATISGAHLYGFPSPDSDFDLRGAHVLPLERVVGLEVRDETVEDSRVIGGLEMDIVSHDVRKFFGLLLKKNGYVLEQLFSPLIVHTTPEHAELKVACRTGLITRHHSHHYFGFAETQWKLFLKESPRRVKPLLYVYRVLLTGIHLMRTGEVQANLVTLDEEFRLPHLGELVERKTCGENTTLADADLAFHEAEYQRLRGELQAAHEASSLPELPSEATRAALNDLLVRVRTKGWVAAR
ncbi:MAG TPA: nucleotidyltransferase domain-containing protein [Verrucomicrobiota bacterium]|nr:nucleotidyltransferase domain-containing protein [Verrucomicrobiota bacterium]